MHALDLGENSEGAALERLGLGEPAFEIIKLGQIVQADGNRHVIGTELLFLDHDGPQMQGFRFVIAALLAVELGQPAHQHRGGAMALAERAFGDLHRFDEQRLSQRKPAHFDVKLADIGQEHRGGGMIGAELGLVQADDLEREGERLMKFALPEIGGVLVIIVEERVGLSPPGGG